MHDSLKVFLNFHTKLQFSYVIEENLYLHFLRLTLIRNLTNKIKPNDTQNLDSGRYLNHRIEITPCYSLTYRGGEKFTTD